jgi:hypothetical protein
MYIKMYKIVLILLSHLFLHASLIAQNLDRNVLQVNSFMEKRTGLYYRESDELIAYAPVNLNKKDLKNYEIIVKCDGAEDLYLNLPIKNILELNIRPIADSKITREAFLEFNKLNDKSYKTYDVFLQPQFDSKGKHDLISLLRLENKVKPKSPLGIYEGRIFYMADVGVAYDPIFGTSRSIRTQMCDAFYKNYFRVNQCDNVNISEADQSVLHKKNIAIKPTINNFGFKIVNSFYKDARFMFGYYNLIMSYQFTFPDSTTKNIEVVNYGFYNAQDPNALFMKALYDNISILLSDKSLADEIIAGNKVFEKKYESDSIIIKRTEVKYVDFKETIKNSVKAVVTIKSDDESFGSGFLIHPDGLIVTNYHVIDGAKSIKVNIGKDTASYDAQVVRYDDFNDIALLKIQKHNLPYLILSNQEELETGEAIIAIGTPARLDLGQSVSKGIISGNRTIDERTYIQTDVSINPGNSGGPIIYETGEVIGVVVMKIMGRGMEGLSFAIPSQNVIKLLNIKYQ